MVGEERGGPRNYGNEGKQILSFIVSFLYIYLYMQRVAVVGGTITAVVIIVVFPLKANTTHSTRDRGVITGPEKWHLNLLLLLHLLHETGKVEI